jgi:hypothetical protein
MSDMSRQQVQRELRQLVLEQARQEGWDEERTEAEIQKALADTDWVLECQKRINLKRN